MESVLAVLGVLVAVVVLAFVVGIVIGRGLPVAHVASRSMTVAAPPERVWELITDPALVRSRGVGDVKTETIESVPPRRLVRRITENGEVYSAFFRFVSRYIVGHHRTIDSFLFRAPQAIGSDGPVTPVRPPCRTARTGTALAPF